MTSIRVLIVMSSHELPESLLTPRERAQLARARTPGRRREWLVSRRALRLGLTCAGMSTDTSTYRFPHPRISLSHTENIAAAAIALDAPVHMRGVGVDIEQPRTIDARAARLFLTPAELAMDPDPRWHLRLWTVKEAIFKSDPANADRLLLDYALDDCAPLAGTARRRPAPHRRFCYRSDLVRGAHLSVGVALAGGPQPRRSPVPLSPPTFDIVADRIYQVLSVPPGTLSPETRIENLAADSFQLVEMVIDVQEEFDVVFTRSQLTEVATVGDLVDLLRTVSGEGADAH